MIKNIILLMSFVTIMLGQSSSYKVHNQDSDKLIKIKLSSVDTLDSILEQAKKQNKLIMIKATSPHCWYCRKMDKEVFDDIDIQNKLSKDFILLEINVDQFEIPYGMDKYYRRVTPSFFVLDGSKKYYSSLPGSWNKEDFTEYINENIGKR